LTQWKSLLGWDDLAWNPRNGENGDITLVVDAASGEKLLASDGQPLRCLEHLLNVVRSKGDHSVPRVLLRVEGHEEEEEDRDLPAVARQAAEEAIRNGEAVRLNPMSARDRKVIHQTLAGRRDVETSSEGEGQYRKVVITPKAK
jgi:spoIIIJ-associated protein